MENTRSSYRTILRSSSIMGAASAANIASGLVKMKIAAVLLGPAGVGLIGLYQNLMQTAATVAAMGLGNVGTRQVAAAQGRQDADGLGRARAALLWGTVILATAGGAGLWLSRDWLALVVVGDPSAARAVGWLGLGVALTVVAGSQSAYLTGMRRIGDVARVSAWTAILGAVLGVLFMLLWGIRGIVAVVLVAPVAGVAAGHWYVAHLPSPRSPRPAVTELLSEWRAMAGLGIAFMLAALVMTFSLLLVRSIIQHRLGAGPLGQFQASWSLGMIYLSFILGAMGTDYYPRLTAVINDHEAAARMVNEQTEVALLLCGPVLLATLALAPWVISLLYSGAFSPAVDILHWQLLGDVLKIISWPLGFVVLARGSGKVFLATQVLSATVFVIVSYLLLPHFGISATGIGFLAMYVTGLPVNFLIARAWLGFRWSPAVVLQAFVLGGAAIAIDIVARISAGAGALLGVPVAVIFAAVALARVAQMAELGGPVARVAQLGRKLFSPRGRTR